MFPHWRRAPAVPACGEGKIQCLDGAGAGRDEVNADVMSLDMAHAVLWILRAAVVAEKATA